MRSNRLFHLFSFTLGLLLFGAIPTIAQDSTTISFTNSLQTTFAVMMLGVVTVFSILTGGLLVVLKRIADNPTIMRAAETGYNNARQDTQDLVKLLHEALELGHRLAVEVVPHSEIERQLSIATNITDEITDGKPMTLEEASDILYNE